MTEIMTTPEFVRLFRDRLPADVNSMLHNHGRLIVLAQKAALAGWTPVPLALECTRDTAGISNPAGVVMHRLAWCADHPPVKPIKTNALPFCSDDCRARAGWIEDADGQLVERCPCRTPA